MTRDNLVLDNINLIYHMMKKIGIYHRREELYDVGMIGLVKAAKTFDKNKGFKFSTYATFLIKNELCMVMRKEYNQSKHFDTISLYEPAPFDEKLTLEDIIESDVNVEQKVFDKVEKELMYDAVLNLTEREQFVLNHMYELNNHERLTQKEIAQILNKTQGHVSRIKTNAIEKIRKKVGV